jgi:hypothetical protein
MFEWGPSLERKMSIAIAVICFSLAVVLTYALLVNSVPEYDSSKNALNIIFRYGVGAKNELDTFEGTFTKDLVMNGRATTRMVLSQEELKTIQTELTEIGFFSIPENFPSNPSMTVDPQIDYCIIVQEANQTREVNWCNNSLMETNIENNLMQMAAYLCDMIEQKPEYKALPPPNGGYA